MKARAGNTIFVSQEQRFLEWFSANFHGNGLESKFQFGAESFYCVSFSEKFHGKSIAGHGYDPDRSLAMLKGAAELHERRAVLEYFRQNPDAFLQNSNGWAVHFSRELAIEAARREALERHILLYTYLHSGWSEFVLLDKREVKNGTAIFICSPYSQNGFFAGMVIYKDHRFPGISLGYLADKIDMIRFSPRWNHALYEAVGFVERGLETGGFSGASENAIYNACRDWLLSEWREPKWKTTLTATSLPYVEVGIQSGHVSSLVPCFEELSFARVEPGSLIPLFTEKDCAEETKRNYISEILSRYRLSLADGRTPIL